MNRINGVLNRLLVPFSSDCFLESFYLKQPLHVPGTVDKFTGLFNWDVLNAVLEQHRFPVTRLRLASNGNLVAANEYSHEGHNGRILDQQAMERLIDGGATLILDEADELHRPLREAAIGLEERLLSKVNINCYASWRRQNGFARHWDRQETIIAQVQGKKEWTIWEPTQTWPLTEDPTPAPPPTGPAVWQGTLAPGDLLYVPRGWWHFVCPVDEPSLHLTITVNVLTGYDLVRWLAARMVCDERVREALPLTADPDAVQSYLTRLKETWQTAWSGDILADYLSAVGRRRSARQWFSFPELVAAHERDLDVNRLVRAVNPIAIIICEAGDRQFAVRADGLQWTLATECKPAVIRASSSDPVLVGELIERCPAQHRGDIKDLLRQWLNRGMLREVA